VHIRFVREDESVRVNVLTIDRIAASACASTYLYMCLSEIYQRVWVRVCVCVCVCLCVVQSAIKCVDKSVYV
jgi:hypothetical protein